MNRRCTTGLRTNQKPITRRERERQRQRQRQRRRKPNEREACSGFPPSSKRFFELNATASKKPEGWSSRSRRCESTDGGTDPRPGFHLAAGHIRLSVCGEPLTLCVLFPPSPQAFRVMAEAKEGGSGGGSSSAADGLELPPGVVLVHVAGVNPPWFSARSADGEIYYFNDETGETRSGAVDDDLAP